MSRTDFLFARPSFLGGMARVLDVGATLQEYNRSSSPEEADATAIYNDFRAIGLDLEVAVKEASGQRR